MQLPQTHRKRVRKRGGGNGGFPEPPPGEPTRVLRCAHEACGTQTRVRVPASLPDRAVRRVVCDGCDHAFEPDGPAPGGGDGGAPPIADGGRSRAVAPAAAPLAALTAVGGRLVGGARALGERLPSVDELPLPQLPDIPRSRLWAWASVPLAALGVVAGLALLQGDGGSAAGPSAAPGAGDRAANATEAGFIREPGFSLALPEGWERTDPPDGAAFAAASPDELADATLWIERAPELSFKQFERRSLAQLEELASNARVTDRVEGPTLESSIVELRADAPVGEGTTATYRVTLRAAGDFRQYFVTVTQPGADPDLLGDAELMHGSLRPEVKLAGVDGDGS